MVVKHHLSESVSTVENELVFEAESDNLISLFSFNIVTDNNNSMANGWPLAVQHMSQQHQVATFNGMKDPAHQLSLKMALINHSWA